MALSSDAICDRILTNTKICHAKGMIFGTLCEQFEHQSLLPEITRAAYQKHAQKIYIEQFEEMSLAIRVIALNLLSKPKVPDCDLRDYHETLNLESYTGEDISQAVRKAAQFIRNESDYLECEIPKEDLGSPEDAEILSYAHLSADFPAGPYSLKIIGAHIKDSIDLSNLDIPFSISFICCHIEGAVLLNETKLIALDLSGSVIDQGVSATLLKAQGAVRARRLVSLGPVDFAGIETGSTFDLADAVLIPENQPPEISSYVADRGMLNIAGGKFTYDVRLDRSRIYGGINMRGAHISGLLFMNDMVLRSPLAHFEILTVGKVNKAFEDYNGTEQLLKPDIPLSATASMNADKDIGKFLHEESSQPDRLDYKLFVETMGNAVQIDSVWKNPDESLQFMLMRESFRASESALRAESLVVDGPIFANGTRINGRVRFQGIKVGRGMSFHGSRFRTARSIRNDLTRLFKDKFFKNLWVKGELKTVLDQYKKPENGIIASQNPDIIEFELDFEGADIGGDLNFGADRRTGGIAKECDDDLLKGIATVLCDGAENPVIYHELFRPSTEGSNLRGKNDGLKKALKKIAVSYGVEYAKYQKIIDKTKKKRLEAKKALEENEVILKADEKNTTKRDEFHKAQKVYYTAVEKYMEAIHTYPQDTNSVELTEDEIRKIKNEVVLAIRQHGRINSTLLIGEIQLTNATIHGSLVFEGLIANVFDGKDTTNESVTPQDHMTRHVVLMRNAVVHGDLDFRNSVGICSVNARKATIIGSVKFCNPVDYNKDTMQYSVVSKRAFFPNSRKNNATLHFQRAQISGNAKFLFDRNDGPNIHASGASIIGKFEIFPAKYNLQLHQSQYESMFANDPHTISEHGTPLPELGVYPLRRFFKNRNRKVLLDAAMELPKTHKYINLRNLTASVFVHAPSAWPKQDGLIVTGLKYESSKIMGPLHPWWRTWPIVWSGFEKFHRFSGVYFAICLINVLIAGSIFLQFGIFGATLEPYAQKEVVFATIAVAHLALLALLSWRKWWLQPRFWPKWGPAVVGVLLLGLASLWIWFDTNLAIILEFICNLGAFNLFALSLIAFLDLYRRIRNTYVEPEYKEHQTMAVKWLLLQRRRFNTRQFFAANRPSEPYIRAAAVLRASGMNLSANEVELERIRERTRALSWRTAGYAKLILNAADAVLHYGFSPARGAAISLWFMFVSACIFSYANFQEIIVPDTLSDTYVIESQKAGVVTQDCPYIICIINTEVSLSKKIDMKPEFRASLYAIELYLPFLDFGIENNWKIINPKEENLGRIKKSIYWCLISLRILGWALITMVILSIAARIETIMARSSTL